MILYNINEKVDMMTNSNIEMITGNPKKKL